MVALSWITPTFAVTGTLSAEDFAPLRSQGFRCVISNRPDNEQANQLTAVVEAGLTWDHGMLFRHVPAAKYDLFSDKTVAAMALALQGCEGPVLAHCQSGQRSAILWAAATARTQPVDQVLHALAAAGFDLEFIRDDLDAQAARSR
jgi:sulfide:quinone oxidoreductase